MNNQNISSILNWSRIFVSHILIVFFLIFVVVYQQINLILAKEAIVSMMSFLT